MGYTTSYELIITPPKNTIPLEACTKCNMDLSAEMKFCPNCGKQIVYLPQDVIGIFRTQCDSAKIALDEAGDTEEDCKWYSHERDLKEFSEEYSGYLFTLHGEGEEVGDIWNKYFKNGKMQKAKAQIIIPEFNEALLE